jgi:SAM-dependent methyltransferase
VFFFVIQLQRMEKPVLAFKDNIPGNYEALLGDFLFEPFAAGLAADLAAELATAPAAGIRPKPLAVLEVACGTGRLTRHLAAGMAADGRLTASDINPAMLSVAREVLPDPRIDWVTADMTELPFGDGVFDLVVSQFGLMFPQDKKQAFGSLRRVLRGGGRLIFSTWAPATENPVWAELGNTLRAALGGTSSAALDVPFSMSDAAHVTRLLEESGFVDVSVRRVRLVGRIDSAELAARGMVRGLPVITLLQERAPDAVPVVLGQLEQRYVAAFGDARPMGAPLTALVFEARIPSKID